MTTRLGVKLLAALASTAVLSGLGVVYVAGHLVADTIRRIVG